MRVLVAEDDPTVREVIDVLLTRRNVDHCLADDGFRAVEGWEKGGIGLIFMDVQMPGMDGYEATRAIREKELERGGHVPIVAMTAHATAGDREKCREAGMDDYLTKPIDFPALFACIARYAERERAS